MAIRVLKSSLDLEERTNLSQLITISPKVKFVPGKKRQPVPPSIKIIAEKGDYYHVPLFFARKYFRTSPRDDYSTVDLTFTGELRGGQSEVVEEALLQLKKHFTTTLALCTGYGKTVVAAYLACKHKLLTLVFVHLDTILVQQKHTFETYTDGIVWVVGEEPPEGFNVIICMRERIHYIPQEILEEVGMLIIDEAHLHCSAKNIPNLLQFCPRYIVLQTATLERPDELHRIMHFIAGKHSVVRKSQKTFKVVKVPIDTVYETKTNAAGILDWTDVKKSTAEDERRNILACEIVDKAVIDGHKPLILTERKDHSMWIYNTLVAGGVETSFLCGSKKGYDDADVLVGTVKKIGTAFDAATFCRDYRGKAFDVIVFMGSFASETGLIQCTGRGLRGDELTIFHFVNDNITQYEKHWRFCVKWYRSQKAKIELYDPEYGK
jgi:superfamily II DNA or RNA helicase